MNAPGAAPLPADHRGADHRGANHRGSGHTGADRSAGVTPPPIRQDRVLMVLFAIGFIAMLGFVVGLALGVEGDDIPILGLAMLTFFLACIPLAVDQGRLPQYRHVFISLLAVIFIVYYVIPALVIFIPAELPIDAAGLGTSALTDPDIAMGQLVVLVALVTLLVTYWLPLGRRIGSRLPRPQYDWPPRVALVVGALMVGMGWSIMAGRVIGLIPLELGSGVIGTLAGAETYSNVLLTYVAIRYRSRIAVALVVFNCLIGGAVGLVTTGKERALISPGMVVLTWILMTRRIRARWVLAGVGALVVLYPASQFLRYGQSSGIRTSQLLTDPVMTLRVVGNFVSQADAGDYLISGMTATANRTDGLGVTSVLVRDTPELSPFQYGRTVGLFFVAFIPRALWPGKPSIQLGKWIAHTYGAGRDIEDVSYIAPTQVGEWYINFGVAGVVFGMFLIGLIVRVTQESLLQGPGTAPSTLAASVLLYLLTRKFQGSVAGAYSEIVFVLAPIVLTHAAFRVLGIVVRLREAPPPKPRPLLGQAEAPTDPPLTATP